jgi:hypothetical protein
MPGLVQLAGASRMTLSLMLTAFALWPVLLPESSQRKFSLLFGLGRGELAIITLVAFGAWLVRQLMRHSVRRSVTDALFVVASLLMLSALFGVVIEGSGNGFFTAAALAEGLYLLLVVHGIAMLLHWMVRDVVTGSTWQRAADALTTGTAMTLIAFWVFAALKLHFVAAVLVAVVAGSYAFLVVMLAFTATVNLTPTARDKSRHIVVTGSPLYRNTSRHGTAR